MIRIKECPPGPSPAPFRQAWVGVVIPLENEDEHSYIVEREKAFEALKRAGRRYAHHFWSSSQLGREVRFKKDICERVEQ